MSKELLDKLSAFGATPAKALSDITTPRGADGINIPETPGNGQERAANEQNGTMTREEALRLADGAKINDFSDPAAPTAPPSETGTISPGQGAQFNAGTGGGVALGNVVGGKTATELMDVLFPSLAVLAASYLGYTIRRNELQLSTKEKEVITPVFQSYLDSLRVDFNNPLYNLLFVVSVVYGSKVIEKIPEFEKAKPKEEIKKEKVERIIAKVEKDETLSDLDKKLKRYCAEKKVSMKVARERLERGVIKL